MLWGIYWLGKLLQPVKIQYSFLLFLSPAYKTNTLERVKANQNFRFSYMDVKKKCFDCVSDNFFIKLASVFCLGNTLVIFMLPFHAKCTRCLEDSVFNHHYTSLNFYTGLV